MSLFKRKDKDGFPYYGYEFTRKGKRYCKTFLGLSKDEVAVKEANHKLAIRNGITLEEPNTLVHSYSVGVERFKEHANNYYTRPEECLYVLDSFAEIVGDKNLDEIELSDIKEYIKLRKGQVKNSTINRELNTIRKLFSVAVSENLITNNPCKDLKYLRIENPSERYLGKEEQVVYTLSINADDANVLLIIKSSFCYVTTLGIFKFSLNFTPCHTIIFYV